MSPSGLCYWVEEIPGTNRQVLITGVLTPSEDDGHVVFQGNWRASNGARGSFSSFEFTPKVYYQGQYQADCVDTILPSAYVQPIVEAEEAKAENVTVPSIFLPPADGKSIV